MDPKFTLGITEIDAQHEEIEHLVDSLRAVIADKNQRRLAHQAVKRLHHLLETHFTYEESLMTMVNYPELAQHRKMHRGVLKLFTDYFDHPTPPGDYEFLGRLIGEKILGHIVEHDVQLIDAVKSHLAGTSGSPV